TEFPQIIGEGICNSLRAAARNWPAHGMPRDSQHQCKRRGDRCVQRKKRMRGNSAEKRASRFVFEQKFRDESRRANPWNAEAREGQWMPRQVQNRLQKLYG